VLVPALSTRDRTRSRSGSGAADLFLVDFEGIAIFDTGLWK
jgi:hypothetical protein